MVLHCPRPWQHLVFEHGPSQALLLSGLAENLGQFTRTNNIKAVVKRGLYSIFCIVTMNVLTRLVEFELWREICTFLCTGDWENGRWTKYSQVKRNCESHLSRAFLLSSLLSFLFFIIFLILKRFFFSFFSFFFFFFDLEEVLLAFTELISFYRFHTFLRFTMKACALLLQKEKK